MQSMLSNAYRQAFNEVFHNIYAFEMAKDWLETIEIDFLKR